MSTEKQPFDSWALIELLGRTRIVGRVTEETIAGAAFVRVDVPADGESLGFTRFYGANAIYCISPVSEGIAMTLLQTCRNEPVSRYDLPQLAQKYGRPDEESPY